MDPLNSIGTGRRERESFRTASKRATCALVAAAFATPLAAEELGWRQNPANGHWYGIPFVRRGWHDGEALAVAQSGHLASVSDSAENTWLGTTFSAFNANGLWIGLNDVAVEGSFAWTSGETLLFTNWSAGEPNNSGDQDGTKLVPASPWRWDDVQTNLTTLTPIVELDGLPHVGWSLPNLHTVPSLPGSFAVGDWNGDGRADLAVPSRSTNQVSLLFGDGSGGFAPAQSFATPPAPVSVAAADFNQDTHLDLAVACGWPQVRIYFGDGTGSIFGVATLATAGDCAQVVAADFDGDLAPDVAVTTVGSNERLLVFRNSGVATFDPPVAYTTWGGPQHASAGDLDADGDVDLVVSNNASDSVSIFHNDGSGVFVSSGPTARGNAPAHVAIADLDGDGNVDLAIPNRLDNLVTLWWGDGSGAFGPGGALPTGINPSWVSATDLDGDLLQDLLIANQGGGSATIYYGRGLGVFDGPHELFVGGSPVCAEPVDLDLDGVLDLAFSAIGINRAVTLDRVYRDCNANGRIDATDIRLGSSTDANSNQIPDECDATGVPFCFGDGTGAACPCGPSQSGSAGHGCANSTGSSGLLAASGITSISADSVTLHASGLSSTSTGLFFQGEAQLNGGLGVPFGDGLRCATQNVIRLVVRTASGGAMDFGAGVAGDPTVSQAGQLPPAGGTRFYQVWYRDAAPFCMSATFNLTNGVRIEWQP